MNPQMTGQMTLSNDSVINVAALLREEIGATRTYRFSFDRFRLDEDLDAVDLAGTVRLTRVSDAILATVTATTSVELECQRCLNLYALPVSIDFDEQFRIAYDVRSGTLVDSELENLDERPEISENHELDFSEPVRQEIILAFPMRRVCGPDCPGPPAFAEEDDDDINGQFAALASLLGPSDDQ